MGRGGVRLLSVTHAAGLPEDFAGLALSPEFAPALERFAVVSDELLNRNDSGHVN